MHWPALLVVYAGGSHSSGAVDRYLGMLEGVLGRFADAEAHFDSAIALEERVGAPPLLARTGYWYGRMLLAREHQSDRARASGLLRAAFETAEALGMTACLATSTRWRLARRTRRRPSDRRRRHEGRADSQRA